MLPFQTKLRIFFFKTVASLAYCRRLLLHTVYKSMLLSEIFLLVIEMDIFYQLLFPMFRSFVLCIVVVVTKLPCVLCFQLPLQIVPLQKNRYLYFSFVLGSYRNSRKDKLQVSCSLTTTSTPCFFFPHTSRMRR